MGVEPRLLGSLCYSGVSGGTNGPVPERAGGGCADAACTAELLSIRAHFRAFDVDSQSLALPRLADMGCGILWAMAAPPGNDR